ncbi:MAG: aminotransferase class I/II-fold pyridoxal phosphate-dependent enzyme, partial [Coriobacteriales bacterium]
MAKVNANYEKLPGSYLFSDIAHRTAAYSEQHPEAKLIRMGIGDVTRPLAPAVIEAMHAAVDDMSTVEGFHGYGPEQGYDFLREAIAKGDYASRGIDIDVDEIFVSDGAKSDCGNIGDILSIDNKVAVCDPVYPVYVDTNAMAGRAGDYDEAAEKWTNITYMPTTAENGFCPALPDEPVD